MLRDRYDEAVYGNQIDATHWSYLWKCSDAAWKEVAASSRWPVNLIQNFAAEAAESEWPVLTSELYAEFELNGNRSNFELLYFRRRRMLTSLCVASCLTGEPIYIEKIVEGLTLIVREGIWTLPAHNSRNHRDGFPPNTHMVDLFSAETAMFLSSLWTCMQPWLGEKHAALGAEIKSAIEERVLLPVFNKTPYWWLGGSNNWGPWCAVNTLISAMQMWPDDERLPQLAYYLSGTIDNFVAHYHADGACDEGPGYWAKAAGAMLGFLEVLYQVSDGAISIFGEQKINNMGQFIRRAHLCDNQFINFADAHAKMLPSPGLILRFGERCQENSLISFAHEIYSKKESMDPGPNIKIGGLQIDQVVFELNWYQPVSSNVDPVVPLCDYMADTEILVARELSTKNQGFILASKGGHNAESHNHNDIGHFILYHDAQPIIIDVGVGEYTADTFNEKRYTNWPISALSHNAPIINGQHQEAGAAFRARNATCEDSDESMRFQLSLLDAYPESAGCDRIDRELVLTRGPSPSVVVQDDVEMSGTIDSYVTTLVSPRPLEVDGGHVVFEGSAVRMRFDHEKFSAVIKQQHVADPILQKSWGDTLWLIELQAKHAAQSVQSRLHFALHEG